MMSRSPHEFFQKSTIPNFSCNDLQDRAIDIFLSSRANAGLGFNSLLCELFLNLFVLDPIPGELQWNASDLFVESLSINFTLCVPDFDADHRVRMPRREF